jgi:hypothetical protein
MKDEKILEVCGVYTEKLKSIDKDKVKLYYNSNEQLEHIEWMLTQIPIFLKAGRKEKANRWLGFVQGVLWARKIYMIEDMKGHNKPDEK